MTRRGRRPAAGILSSIALAVLAAASLAGPEGWKESSTGWWDFPRQDRKASFSDNGIAMEVKMAPGTGVTYERAGAWPSSSRASIRISSDRVNTTGNDYVPSEASFPVSVTFAFGDDSLDLGFRSRLARFFRHVWYGFPPAGIRLTYAWGNRVPSGSMYRLEEEETVFAVAGGDEAGKEISVDRRLSEDFQAAYARAPKGPVTSIRVRAERPPAEKGPLAVRLSLGFPAN